MLNIHIEMPSGCVSRGYDRKTEDKATETFDQVVAQLRAWPKFAADVVLSDERSELQREKISNA